MKHYTGTRAEGGGTEVYVHDRERRSSTPLKWRADLVDHRAQRLNWGITDPAGASQLALALCADTLGDDKLAKALHRKFQARYVDGWSQGRFEITAETIISVCGELENSL